MGAEPYVYVYLSFACISFLFWISHVLAFLQVSCIILSLISLYFHILFIIFYSSHLLAFRNLLYSSDCLIFLKCSHISLSFDKFPYIYRFSRFSRLRFSFSLFSFVHVNLPPFRPLFIIPSPFLLSFFFQHALLSLSFLSPSPIQWLLFILFVFHLFFVHPLLFSLHVSFPFSYVSFTHFFSLSVSFRLLHSLSFPFTHLFFLFLSQSFHSLLSSIPTWGWIQ